MTSFATIFGVLPIAIGLGAGGEARRPLGIAVVGGLLFSTFLTLVLVPLVYTLLARFTNGEAAEQAADHEDAQEAALPRSTAGSGGGVPAPQPAR
jgi:HAE1 family hydrophobic/amphiphilic exporter-1